MKPIVWKCGEKSLDLSTRKSDDWRRYSHLFLSWLCKQPFYLFLSLLFPSWLTLGNHILALWSLLIGPTSFMLLKGSSHCQLTLVLWRLALNLQSPSQVPKTLIFCLTKDACCHVYTHLWKKAGQSVKRQWLGLYHAIMTEKGKEYHQKRFKSGQSPILVATKYLAWVWTSVTFNML